MTKVNDSGKSAPDRPAHTDRVEITIPMLAVGMAAYEEWEKRKNEYISPLADLAGTIYRAMERRRRGHVDAGQCR